MNYWKSIWTQPRVTIRAILAENPKQQVFLLTAISGVSQMLDRASIKSLGDKASLDLILFMSILMGPLVGIVSLYISGALMRITGGWLGGKGNQLGIRAAFAWSGVPIVASMVIWVPQLLLYGNELFRSVTPNIEANPVPYLALSALELLFTGWAIVIFLKMIAEVHEFSVWRALGCTILALLLVVVFIMLIALGVGTILN